MIKHIEIGEIIRIGNDSREWVMTETTHKNGTMDWEQPTLVLLHKITQGINKRPYYRKNKIVVEELPTKKFSAKKLSNVEAKK